MRYELHKASKTPWEIKLPKNIEEFAHKSIEHPIIYNRYEKKAFCFVCGEYFRYAVPGGAAPVARVVHAMERFKARDFITCPLCGHRGKAVPHTARKEFVLSMLLTGRNEGETLYITLLSAYYLYEKNQFALLKEKTGRLFIEELVMINRKEQISLLNYGDRYVRMNTLCIHQSIDEKRPHIHPSAHSAVRRSCLKFCKVNFPAGRDYSVNDTLKRMALNAKYPQMEYIKKAGLGDLEKFMVWGRPTYLRPNWKRKNLPGLLGLTSQDIDKLKQWKMFDIDHIAAYKEIRKYHKKITKHSIEAFFDFFSDIGPFVTKNKYDITFYGMDPVRTAKYLTKIYEGNRPQCSHGAWSYSRSAVVREYKDYLKQLGELEYPKYDYYLYPKDFFEAHDKISAEYRKRLEETARKREAEEQRRKAKQQEAFEKEYLPKLQALAFSDGVFFVRPLVDEEEFRKEGQNNVNCVASYYDKVRRGKTAVFVIRRCDTPNESLVTVELQGKAMVQCRARGNKAAPDDVKAFADYWMKEIVKKKGKKAA